MPSSRSVRTPWCLCCGSSGDNHCRTWRPSASISVGKLTILNELLLNEPTLPVNCGCSDDICAIVYYLNSFFLREKERDRVREASAFTRSSRESLGVEEGVAPQLIRLWRCTSVL